jgi:hypothetical protein
MPPGGCGGGGYLKVQRHLRTAVMSVGFALVTAAPFTADLAVPSISQAQLTGYKYPPKTVRQTEPQDGWLYTASTPAFDPAQYQPPWSDRTPAPAFSRYRYDGYPQTDWIYQNLPVADVWTEAKFQNIAGDLTPTRSALKFRYPLASSGFSTDGSTPDVWDATKFQNVSGDRTAERRQYDPRFEYHKFAFGLLDARVVMPAIDQLRNSERAAQRKGRPIVTPDSLGWLYENLPIAFDPQYLVHSEDGRLRERYKKVPQLDQPSQAWIYTAVPAFDPQYLVHSIDDRMREQYKKVPQLDQPSQAWIYNSVPPFDPQYFIQVSAPTRMADRDKLDLRLAQYYNDMAWLRDVLGLPDPAPGRLYRRTAKGWQRIWRG